MKNKKEMLMSYIKANVAPILVNFIFEKDIPGAIVLSADVDVKELNGYYGSVASSVDYKENKGIPTAGTDGKTIYYNPDFLGGLSAEQQTLPLLMKFIILPLIIF